MKDTLQNIMDKSHCQQIISFHNKSLLLNCSIISRSYVRPSCDFSIIFWTKLSRYSSTECLNFNDYEAAICKTTLVPAITEYQKILRATDKQLW